MCLGMSFFFRLGLASFQSRDFQKSFVGITRCGCFFGICHILWLLEIRLRKIRYAEISPRPRGRLLTSFPHEPLPALGIVHFTGDCFPLHRQRVSGDIAEFPASCGVIFLRCDHGLGLEGLGGSHGRMACELPCAGHFVWKSPVSRLCGIPDHGGRFCCGIFFWKIHGAQTPRHHACGCGCRRADVSPHHQPRRMDGQPDVSENFRRCDSIALDRPGGKSCSIMGILAQHGWSESDLHRRFSLRTICIPWFSPCSRGGSSKIKLAPRPRYLYPAPDFTN